MTQLKKIKKSLHLELQRERLVTRDWGRRMEQDSLRLAIGAITWIKLRQDCKIGSVCEERYWWD
jgi:hypothetical protein